MRFIAVAVVVGFVTLAIARPALADPLALPPPPVQPDEKDPALAYILSVGGALVPIGIVAASAGGDDTRAAQGVLFAGAAMIFLPSAGHWYAGQAWTWGTAMRAVGAGALSLQLAYYINCEDCSEHTAGDVVSVASLALMVSGVVYDVATSGAAVRRWNDKHRTVVPIPAPVRMASGWGVGVVGAF